MTGKKLRKSGIAYLFSFILIAALAAGTALADDPEQMKYLPAQWVCSDEVQQEEDEEPHTVDLVLTLEENGEMSLQSSDRDGKYTYSYAGTWSSEYVPDSMDRLTFLFTSTDNPAYADSEYSAECVYDFYTESWVENDTWTIYLLLEEQPSNSTSPFEDIYEYDAPALHREQEPNMRVANCKDFVSLRAQPSTSSKRLAKVPLGALVLAVPGAEETDGFIWCTYQDEYGYILAEYLEPAE